MAYSALFKLDTHDLRSEAEVETRLLAPLFKDLNYPATSIIPKKSVPPLLVASGSKKVPVQVDFILKALPGTAKVVVEAKDPRKSLSDAWGQAAGYALTYNADKPDLERIKWLLISNGHITSLYQHDSSQPTLTLQLADFVSGSPPYAALRAYIKFNSADASVPAAVAFDVIAPDKLVALFNQSHNLIWKKEKKAPAEAFFEFCKFIFIKITEDKARKKNLSDKNALFPMTTDWLNALEKTSKHPVRDILFKKLHEELEVAIKHDKKRIFDPGETLNLKADTCRELIKRFERIDLSSIDEDLNGRMFEVFLNEAVRGRELGQYFTPRPLVEFMTRIALANYQDIQNPPKIIDPCCGTAGFLIEAMAFQLAALRNETRLNSKELKDLAEKIKNETLFGIDGNQKVSRVARINMYLHGDGGSHIFHGDGLDNDPQVEDDMSDERADEVKDHAKTIKENDFDLVLTNPPFSMAYSVDEPDEERILRQLALAGVQTKILISGENADENSAIESAKIKSNVLFLYRNQKLLKPGGEMLIVVDDTVLNGETLLPVRRWLLENFVLLGVHSLPFNAFFKAKANIKTSALHFRKKTTPDDEQGHVFMSICNNIGHDSSLKDTPERNNLNDILNVYLEWKRTGKFSQLLKQNQDPNENLDCPEQVWLVAPKKLQVERIDAFFYAPDLQNAYRSIELIAERGDVEVMYGKDFKLARKLTKKEKEKFVEDKTQLKYVEISDVTRYGLITSSLTGTFDQFPTRGQYQVERGDILVAINNSSRGTVVLVPNQFHGAICTSGFLVIRPANEQEGLLLWFALRSEVCRQQIYYLAQTASQPEIKLGAWRERFLIPIPKGKNRAKALAESKLFQSHLDSLLDADKYRFSI
jgi:type I restriction enzyme M protein